MRKFFAKLNRVALSFAAHLIFTIMALGVFRLAGLAYELLFGSETHLLFDKVPVSYMLDAGDFVTFALLLWKLSKELWDALSERDDD